MNKLFILILLLAPLKATAGSHSLTLMVTSIKGDTPFPKDSAVVLLDDIQVMYYDTIDNKLVYRGQNNSIAGPGHSDFKYIDHVIGFLSENLRRKVYYLKNHYNDTNNVWILQRTATCELLDDDQPGGLMTRDAYNGESGDVDSYNPERNTLHFNRVWPDAADSLSAQNIHYMYEYIFHPTCISILQTNLAKERNRVLKKVKPRVRLLQKQGAGSTVLLTCLATGFYPRHINLTLLRDGQPVPDHQISGGELLPNGDETYQMRKSLEVSTEELQQHHYTCTAQHLSLDNKLDTNLEHNWDSVTTSVVSTVIVAVSTVFVCLVGGAVVLCVIMCRKKLKGRRSRTPLHSDSSSSSNMASHPETQSLKTENT